MDLGRLTELASVPRPSFTNAMRKELIDEIERLQQLVATRPATHEILLRPDGWSARHPITCDPHACTVVTNAVAERLYNDIGDEDGEVLAVEQADGSWAGA